MTSTSESELALRCDVLVVGGGPAGAWSALSAKASGARDVVLVDKGYCGSSGATASANTGVWYAEPEARARVVAQRLQQSAGLASEAWMERVLDATYQQLAQLEAWGFPFPKRDDGLPYRANLRGADYMHFLRRQLQRAGVRIMDHSPALELLVSQGSVVGAQGFARQQRTPYRVRAGAVVLASGGCAYLSKTLGCDVNTGDGLLMALEVGATLSGMEFSAQYGICPAYSSVTKGLPYVWATFSDEAGNVIESSGDRLVTLGRALLQGPVYAVLDKATPEVQGWLRAGQPNCFLPHDRLGVDPFRERFPIRLRCEGTVRGSGGIRVVDERCASDVPGLFVAGDAASREVIVGASSGGGAPNAAWAISSGSWAGRAAALHAESLGTNHADRTHQAAGGVGLRPHGRAAERSADELVHGAQAELLPLDKNLFRSETTLTRSLAALDALWNEASTSLYGEGDQRVRAREAAALLACGRHAYRSALLRSESRGLHHRLDCPSTDPAQSLRHLSTGLDVIHVNVATNPSTPAAA